MGRNKPKAFRNAFGLKRSYLMSQEILQRQGIRDMPAICESFGIEYAIISPGSRNAPLIIAFTKYSTIRCLSITDERSAAFFALGIAQYSRKPVVLICTSGTAALNFAPAVAEAYYQNIPLLIFTADRPKEWIDQGDGQTIRQNGIFQNYCKAAFELPPETRNPDELWHVHRTVSQAIDLAIQDIPGPVHINVPLHEPLYSKLPEKQSKIKILKSVNGITSMDERQKGYISEQWLKYKRKMLIIGSLPKDSLLNAIVNELALREDLVIVAENLSNVVGSQILYAPETLFSAVQVNEAQSYRPDLLITAGSSIVSKKLKQFVRNFKPEEHWDISSSSRYIDLFQGLTKIFVTSLDEFLENLKKLPSVSSGFAKHYSNRWEELTYLQSIFFNKIVFSDLEVFQLLMKIIPGGSVVHLANSTPVRYSQMFRTRSDIEYYSNRGTSGIDGCVSTAAGAAFASGKPTVIITGDLAFLYDSNALWNNYIKPGLKIVVINNTGGNIFRLIETSTEINDIMDYFETPQNVDIKKLVEAFGLAYFFMDSSESAADKLKEYFAAPKAAVLEIKTDPFISSKVYKEYFKHIKQLTAV